MSNIIYSLNEMAEASAFIRNCDNSRIFCFYGDLGAGKTTLIKALLRDLGATDAGHSPTFGLAHEYHTPDGALLAYHLDCYRIENLEEALDMGIEEYLNADCYTFIEWPERIEDLLPGARTDLFLETINATTRKLTAILH